MVGVRRVVGSRGGGGGWGERDGEGLRVVGSRAKV